MKMKTMKLKVERPHFFLQGFTKHTYKIHVTPLEDMQQPSYITFTFIDVKHVSI
jgi:hypothetical protein